MDLNRMQSIAVNSGKSAVALSQERPLMVAFVRHGGCTFCREMLSELKDHKNWIYEKGIQILIVHMGTESQGKDLLGKYDLSDVMIFSDPEKKLYASFGLGRGTLKQLFGPKVLLRGIETAFMKGHGQGPLQGDGFQMPGVFLLDKGAVKTSFVPEDASEIPDFKKLLS